MADGAKWINGRTCGTCGWVAPDGLSASAKHSPCDEKKVCRRCNREQALVEFGADARCKDGRGSWCRDCRREYMRGRKGDPAKRRAAARASEKRYPDRRRARERVKDAIRRGDLPSARACACVDCKKPAAAYDHHLGYKHALAVQAVCHECHGLRSRSRGEHKKLSGSRLDGVEHKAFPEVANG